MPRIDAWDKQVSSQVEIVCIGAARDFLNKYDVGASLGSGGFGTVKVVTEKETGKEYACKTICKTLEEQGIGGNKQTRHIDNVRREVAVLRRLRGTLNVAQLKQVYEDDTDIHIVMEYCSGGELWHRIGNKHYTERTVWLQTLHQRGIMTESQQEKDVTCRRLLVSRELYCAHFLNVTPTISCTGMSNQATSCC